MTEQPGAGMDSDLHEPVPQSAEAGSMALMLDAALESIPYGFCVWDTQFRMILWNRHYLSLHGFAADRIYSGIPIEDVVMMSCARGNHPGQSPAEVLAAYKAELAANRSGARARSHQALAAGRTVEIAHVFAPGLGWVVTHEDVTEELARGALIEERKHELERQNLRLDAAINNIGQGLAMFDPRGRLVIANEAYRRIYDLSDALVAGGVGIEDMIRHLYSKGLRAWTDSAPPVEIGCEQYVERCRELVAKGRYGRGLVEFDGRSIVVQHHPMADGGWVATHEDITLQRATEARMRHIARHDTLTDLPNRMGFLEALKAEEANLARGARGAVLAVNINRFKALNDAMGHATGDEVLRQVAVRLLRLARPMDTVARFGGDEFVLLLRDIDGPEAVVEMAERAIGVLRAPLVLENQSIALDISVGIAMSPGDGVTAEDLTAHAELALDRARREGPSTYHWFEPGMDAELQRRRQIETGLRQALVRNELHLAFQPILDIDADRVVAFETLLRWTHPERGLVQPVDFVPVAEQTGLIIPIGEWVLNEACRAAAAWPEDVRVAVNLSAVQFKVPGLVGIVAAALRDNGLPPDRLELEITESVLLADTAQTMSTLHRLRRMGVRISMDDFGTGYSSLSYLRSFPFDTIKIDRSFMRDAEAPDGLAIIRAVIGLGRALGMRIIAEGVESEAELEVLRREGCDEAQGFLFSRPVGVEAAALFLNRAPRRERMRIA